MTGHVRGGAVSREQVGRGETPESEGLQSDGLRPAMFWGEELVDDVRHGVTPAQMVEQKLLVLLGGGSPGLVAQAGCGSSDPRRTPGGGP